MQLSIRDLFDSFGSSPSQMIAICPARFARCRSMQFDATFVVPSSNHLIETFPGSKQVIFTFVNGLIQSILFHDTPKSYLAQKQKSRTYLRTSPHPRAHALPNPRTSRNSKLPSSQTKPFK